MREGTSQRTAAAVTTTTTKATTRRRWWRDQERNNNTNTQRKLKSKWKSQIQIKIGIRAKFTRNCSESNNNSNNRKKLKGEGEKKKRKWEKLVQGPVRGEPCSRGRESPFFFFLVCTPCLVGEESLGKVASLFFCLIRFDLCYLWHFATLLTPPSLPLPLLSPLSPSVLLSLLASYI